MAKPDKYKTYQLSFPTDLADDQVIAWIKSISGTLRAHGLSTLFSPPSMIALEVWASNRGIMHRLKVPWQYADYVISQLRSLVPGIRVTPETEYIREDWNAAVELSLTDTSRKLRINSLKEMSGSLLAAVQSLEGKEKIMMQWVVTPVLPASLPIHKQAKSTRFSLGALISGNEANQDEVNDRRAKLSEPNLLAVMRVAAKANTPGQAEHLIYRVRQSLASVRTSTMRFEKRAVSKRALQDRIDKASGSMFLPIQLAASELAGLIAWPIGNPFVAGISPSLSRHLPPSINIPDTGRILGTSNMSGAERNIAMSYASATRHTHCIGRSGTGKSTLLANMMAQDMETGHGVILIEGKGDLFEAALDRIPSHRLKDVIIIDINDTKYPVGFNILDQGNSDTAVDELSALIELMYRDASKSMLAPQVLYHMMHALAEVPNTTFIDLPSMLTPQGTEEALWRDDISRQVKNPEVKLFLQRYLNMERKEQDRLSAPVYNRTWELTSRQELRYIFGQRKSSFQMKDVIRDNKILLVNLNGSRVGKQTASLAGTLLVNGIWQAVRLVTPDKPNFLYLDEFQDFINLPVDMESILAKARSSKLGTVLAHQNLSQLPMELRSGVMANTSTKVVFRVSHQDAQLMSREFGKFTDDSDFTRLPEHEVIAMVATDAGSSPPVSMNTKPPGRSTNNANEARELSRKTYGRAVEAVREEIMTRKAPDHPRYKRPPISGQGW